MKILLLCCVLLTLSLEWYHRTELARAQGDLTAARAALFEATRRRAPRADLEQARAQVAGIEAKLQAAEAELQGTREQLALSQESVRSAEQHFAAAARASAAVPEEPLGLLKGSYTQVDDTRVYSPDAQLKVARGVLVTSPTGLMLSDNNLATIAGDLAVETAAGTMQVAHAFLDVSAGKVELTADHVTFSGR